MRPDEYKQKRSRQYQAKTKGAQVGLESKDGQAKETVAKKAQKGRNSDKPTGKAPTNNPPMAKLRQPFTHQVDNQQNPEGSSEEEPRKWYGRRKIETNAYRYDHDNAPDSEDEMVFDEHGSLASLLTDPSRVDTPTQFKFQEENDLINTRANENEDTLRLLAVDCIDLCRALQCIPLHNRLDIDRSFFEVEQLEHQYMEAHSNLDTWVSQHPPTLTTNQAHSTVKDTPPTPIALGLSNQMTSSSLLPQSAHNQSVSSNSPIETQYFPANPTQSKPTTTAHPPIAQPPSPSLHDAITTLSLSPTQTNNNSLEDDLDALLGADQESTSLGKSTPPSPEARHGLESLVLSPQPTLNGRAYSDIPDTPHNLQHSVAYTPQEDRKEEDLEDWLDSVLDD